MDYMIDDKVLLRQIREQDSESAFRQLFEAHYDRLYRAALFFVRREDWAKDVVLDVLAGIWERRHSMVIPDDFRHFSYVMVRNMAFNVLRRESFLDSDAVTGDDAMADVADEVNPEQLLEQSELFEAYERLVSALPDLCRQVFMLVKEDGHSYADVAQQLGISVKTVDAQLQKALAYLRTNLSQYLNRDAGRRFFMLFL